MGIHLLEILDEFILGGDLVVLIVVDDGEVLVQLLGHSLMGERLLSQGRLHLLLSKLLSLKQLFLLMWAQLGFDLSQMVHLELNY